MKLHCGTRCASLHRASSAGPGRSAGAAARRQVEIGQLDELTGLSTKSVGNLTYWLAGAVLHATLDLSLAALSRPLGLYVGTTPPTGPPPQLDSEARCGRLPPLPSARVAHVIACPCCMRHWTRLCACPRAGWAVSEKPFTIQAFHYTRLSHSAHGRAALQERHSCAPQRRQVDAAHAARSTHFLDGPPTAAGRARQGNVNSEMTYGGGWDQLVAPMATCVSYAKDLAPLSYNDQARARPAQGRSRRLPRVALTASPGPPSARAPRRTAPLLSAQGRAAPGGRRTCGARQGPALSGVDNPAACAAWLAYLWRHRP